MSATSGYYRTNLSALTVREMIRMRGWLSLPLTWFLTRFVAKPQGGHWMPGLTAEIACAPEELSARCWQLTEKARTACEGLGYRLCATSRLKDDLNPLHREAGSLTLVHENRAHIGHLFCIRHQLPPPLDQLRETVVIAFTAAFPTGSLVVTTNRSSHFDPLPDETRIPVDTTAAAAVHDVFVQAIARRKETPRTFADLPALNAWLDARNLAGFEARVRRGLFVPMTAAEIARARQAAAARKAT